MLSSVMYWANRVEGARRALGEVEALPAAVIARLIDDAVNPRELERFLNGCETEARRWQIEPRDSIVYRVLELLDAYEGLLARAEAIAGGPVDIPRGILESRPYWKEESCPTRVYIPMTFNCR